MFEHLRKYETKYNELTAGARLAGNRLRFRAIPEDRERQRISEIVEKYREYKDLKRGIAGSKTMVAKNLQRDMRTMAQEITSLEARLKAVEEPETV